MNENKLKDPWVTPHRGKLRKKIFLKCFKKCLLKHFFLEFAAKRFRFRLHGRNGRGRAGNGGESEFKQNKVKQTSLGLLS
jgi:hypothetical protein